MFYCLAMSDSRPHPPAVKGRGATHGALSTRFGLPSHHADGDWLDDAERIDGKAPPLRTTVTEEHPRSILTFNRSPDIPFDRSINAYRGCEHGCIYCYARPSHAWLDLSPGLDFETQLFAKPGAPDLLRQTLARPGYAPAPIAIGTNTDPYQPIEARYRITRHLLEICLETRHPIIITTKSDRVLRDLDLLCELARLKLTGVTLSVTSLDSRLARQMEPRAAAPHKRLQAVAALAKADVPVYVNIAPIVPALTDHEIEAIAAQAALHGAYGISAIPLRLPHEVAPLFEAWLAEHFPDRAAKVMAIVRSLREGKTNDPSFHGRMKGKGPWAQLLATRMALARKRHGWSKARIDVRSDLFTPPAMPGQQLSLF